MPKYFAAPGTPFSDKDAQEIGPELQRLAEEGASSVEEIVEYARTAETPLRRHLHMDRPLEEVADAWYRFRARKVAGSIMVRVKTASGGFRDVRAFHSVTVTVAEPEGDRTPVKQRYMTLNQVRDNKILSEQVVAEALERLEAFRERYEGYRDVLSAAHPVLRTVMEADGLAAD